MFSNMTIANFNAHLTRKNYRMTYRGKVLALEHMKLLALEHTKLLACKKVLEHTKLLVCKKKALGWMLRNTFYCYL